MRAYQLPVVNLKPEVEQRSTCALLPTGHALLCVARGSSSLSGRSSCSSQRPGHRRFPLSRGLDQKATKLRGALKAPSPTAIALAPPAIVASSPARLEEFDVGELVRTPVRASSAWVWAQMSCEPVLPGRGGHCGTLDAEQHSQSGRRAPAEHSEPRVMRAAAIEAEAGAEPQPERDRHRVTGWPSLPHSHRGLAR